MTHMFDGRQYTAKIVGDRMYFIASEFSEEVLNTFNSTKYEVELQMDSDFILNIAAGRLLKNRLGPPSYVEDVENADDLRARTNEINKLLFIAEWCHRSNRYLQKMNNQLGNDTVPVAPKWSKISQDMKDSTVSGVRGILAGNTAQESHENWMKDRHMSGWKYGPFKDNATKTHPNLIPYNELPESEKFKDEMFRHTVHVANEYYEENNDGDY